MTPKLFSPNAPRVTDFTPLISSVPKLLRSGVEKELQNDRKGFNRPLALEPASQASIVSACDSLLATIDTFKQAKNDLDALRTYFDAVEEHANKQLYLHHALLSPIRRVPNEVLQLIFIQVHAASNEKERLNPITTKVCSFWRRVAEATPFLWSTISIDLTTPEGVEAELVAAQARLQQARDHPLSILLFQKESAFLGPRSNATGAPNDSSRDFSHLLAVVAFLVKLRDRLESIAIMPQDPRCDIAHHLVSRCHPPTAGVKFNKLRELRISFKSPKLSESQVQTLCNASPALEVLHTSVVPEVPGSIHWENITEFKGKMERRALAQLCTRARRLERAEIHASCWGYVIKHHPPIRVTHTFGCLTSLSLMQITTGSPGKLATIPRPPALRHLIVSDSPHSATYPSGNGIHLVPLLQAWGSELEYFATGFIIPVSELRAILQATPKLRGLRLLADHPTPVTIFTLVPGLTHLEFHASLQQNLYSERTVRKVLSRPLNPKSLKRLALKSVSFYPELPVGGTGLTYFGDERLPRDIREPWERLAQELEAVGLRVREYRSLEKYRQPSTSFAFDGEFFKDRGLLPFG